MNLNLSRLLADTRRLSPGAIAIVAAATFATPAEACFNCNLIDVPWWPYQAWGCDPASFTGNEGCVSDGWSYCNTYGATCTGNPGCFLAGTLVSTPSGDRPIESLEVGDAIWCVGEDGRKIAGKITETHRDVSHGYYRLNDSTFVTASHRFLSSGAAGGHADFLPASSGYEQHPLGEWTPMQGIRVGQTLRTMSGDVEVESIEFIDRGVRVFNLEVSPHRNYIANGYVVHNAKPDPHQP